MLSPFFKRYFAESTLFLSLYQANGKREPQKIQTVIESQSLKAIVKVINADDKEEYPDIEIIYLDGAFGSIAKCFEPSDTDILASCEIRNGILPDVEVTGNIWE
jgi:hypothetical protein